MSRRALQAFALLVPAVALGLWEIVRHSLLDPVLPTGWGNLVSALIVALTTFGFIQAFANLLTDQIRETAAFREQAAVMHERQRIARDMHDRVAQALFYLDVKLAEIERLQKEGDLSEAVTAMVPLREHVRDTADEVRSVIANLKHVDAMEPFPELVHRLAAAFPQQSEAVVTVTMTGEFAVPAAVCKQMAAIMQEALTNADKHATASSILVHADGGRDRLALTVSDDGCGFDPFQEARGHGLAIMAERAVLAGGHLRVESKIGSGTTIALEVQR